MARLLVTALVFGLIVGPGGAHAAKGPPQMGPQPAWVPDAARLDSLRASLDVPGLAFVALSDCKPLPPINVGLATLGPDQPVSDQTVFEAASLSKPVFAYVVLSLVEAGVITLDEPIARSLPLPRLEDTAFLQTITPQSVLAHRTGLPNWAGDAGEPGSEAPLAFIASQGQYSYSGEAYELLRAFIEARTGETLQTLFRRTLGELMPLSTFEPPVAESARPARGYAKASDPVSGRDLDYLRRAGSSAAGLVTSASDYARFVSRLCERSGLSSATYDMMFTPLTPITNGELPASASYGLGWIVMPLDDDTTILHGGSNDEFRSFAAFSPGTREGVVMFANGRYGGDLIDAILEEIR